MARTSVLLLTLIASLSAGSSAAQNRVDGWGKWYFGESLDDVLSFSGDIKWNSASVERCRSDMEIKGCLLSTFDSPSLPLIDAIPLYPQVAFDEHGLASEVILTYDHEGGINQQQCLNIFGRLVDWQVKEENLFKSDEIKQGKADKQAGWIIRQSATPEGLPFSYGEAPKRDSFVTSVVRHSASELPKSPETSIFSSFLVVNRRPICNVTIDFYKT